MYSLRLQVTLLWGFRDERSYLFSFRATDGNTWRTKHLSRGRFHHEPHLSCSGQSRASSVYILVPQPRGELYGDVLGIEQSNLRLLFSPYLTILPEEGSNSSRKREKPLLLSFWCKQQSYLILVHTLASQVWEA